MEDKRFMYDKVYDELNRCRDWPLKILGFTSGLFIAMLGFLKIFTVKVFYCEKVFLILGISAFFIYCIAIIVKQHLEYLRYRNIQIRIQKEMGIKEWKIDDERIIPREWDNELKESIWTNFQGWMFYAFYIFCLSVFSIYIIVKL